MAMDLSDGANSCGEACGMRTAEVLAAIRNRWSPRSFLDKPVAGEVLRVLWRRRGGRHRVLMSSRGGTLW
jgi:hypothetical protein